MRLLFWLPTNLSGNHLLEITTTGMHVRAIELEAFHSAWGLAYSSHGDVIAMSQWPGGGLARIALLNYVSGAVVRYIDMLDGRRLSYVPKPFGLCLSADGARVLCADFNNNRVSVHSTRDGEFMSDILVSISPLDVLLEADGSVIVSGHNNCTGGSYNGGSEPPSSSILYTEGGDRKHNVHPIPMSLARLGDNSVCWLSQLSQLSHGADLVIIRCMWATSTRATWIASLCG